MEATHARPWRTRANALTALRLLAAPALAWAVFDGAAGLAFALFTLAVATDLADGPVARRYGEATAFGGVLDHATDATFVSIGTAALACMGEVNGWLAPAIALAFLQYAVDSRVVRGRALRASALGRWNGIGYFVLVGIPVVRDGLGLAWPPQAWVAAFAWLLLATTVLSMLDRALAPPVASGEG